MGPKNKKKLLKKKEKEIFPSSSSEPPEMGRTNKKKDVSGTADTGLLALGRLGVQLFQFFCCSDDDDVSKGNQVDSREGNEENSRKGNDSREGNEDGIIFLKLLNTLCVAFYADLQGPANPNILFLPGATNDEYLHMIKEVRDKVSRGARTVAGIPVLHGSVPDLQLRFVLVHLINHKWDTIVVTIDASNVYLVGCRARKYLYLLLLEKAAEKSTLFTYTNTCKPLELSGHYKQLQNEAGKSRMDISLGPTALHKSVTRLLNGKFIHESFLVIIQMVCESARFDNIAQRVGESFDAGKDFKPSTDIVQWENKWSNYSKKLLLTKDGSSINDFGGIALLLDSLHLDQDDDEASTSESPQFGRRSRGGRGGRRGRGRQ